MITVRPGSHMYNLLRLLSVSGEYPSSSLGMLGNERTVKAMVHKMEAVRDIRVSADGAVLKTRLFQVSGKGGMRTVRIVKGALPVLRDIHPDALGYYLAAYPENRFTGDRRRIWRNHRVGEALAICMAAGAEAAPYALPELQKESIRLIVPETPAFYTARNFKKIYEAELNKTIFTRVTGLLFHPGGCYAVYNARNAVMKWSGLGELKARQELSEIVRMNAGLDEAASALLIGASQDVALRTLAESDISRNKHMRFDRIYQNIHFIPLNQDGIDLIRILTLPDWHEKLLGTLFDKNIRARGHSPIEFDAFWENRYIFSHLDSDIARLMRLGEALRSREFPLEVLCFPWQPEFVKSYLGSAVAIRQIGMQAVLERLGIAEPIAEEV